MNALLNVTSPVNGNGGPPVVNGRGLARRRLSLDEQVQLAADLATGKQLFLPSMAQACMHVGVPQKAVVAELRARAARKNGHSPKDLAAAIVEAWNEASEYELEVAVRTIGVGEVWNVIARVVA
jgi:hypothetical protein